MEVFLSPFGATIAPSDRYLARLAPTELWTQVDGWRMTLRDACDGAATTPGRKVGLASRDAIDMRFALKAMPADLLLPGEDGVRRAAIAALKHSPLAGLVRPLSLSASQVQLLDEALRLGDACMRCGPIGRRRLRTPLEQEALTRLAAWVGTGPDSRQRAGLATALRAPDYRDGVPVIRWREPSSDADLCALALPPQALMASLLPPSTARLELHTHSLQADPSIDAELSFFHRRTLKPRRLCGPAGLAHLPRHFECIDLGDLDPRLNWQGIEPLLLQLPRLQQIIASEGQLMSAPPADWRPDLPQGPRRFTRIGTAVEESGPASLRDFLHTLEAQLRAFELDGTTHPLSDKHLPRLKRLQRDMTEHPMPPPAVHAILRRDPGSCLDANLMRLDGLEALGKVAGLRGLPEIAVFALRQALTFRAHQAAAHRHHRDKENLEIGAGLAWAVDCRLSTLPNVGTTVSRPVFGALARLPGAIHDGAAVNDLAAADALIAAEVDEGFPTLAHQVCWDAGLASVLASALDTDAAFQAERAVIEQTFQREHEQAVAQSDDPQACSDAFQRKLEALQQARLGRLIQSLRPLLALVRLRGADLPATPPGDATS